MALPPQMAVPNEIRDDVRCGVLNSLPSRYPSAMVKLMLTAVYRKASLPVFSNSGRFMPKPRPTTEACSSPLLQVEVAFVQGLPTTIPNEIPATSAIGALTAGQQQASKRTQNTTFIPFMLDTAVSLGKLISHRC